MTQSAPARRPRRHGSTEFSKSASISSAVARKARCFLAALLVVVLQVESFAPRATWSPCSTSTGPFGRDEGGRGRGRGRSKGRGRGRGMPKVFDTAVAPSGRSSGESLAWSLSPRAASRLWIAREDQQQQQQPHRTQHRGHEDHPPSTIAGVGWKVANETSTTPIRSSSGSSSSSSSSSSSDSGANINAPVLPVVGDIRRVNMDALRVRKGVALQEEGRDQAGGGGSSFVDLFRACAPYIRAHLGAVMVIHMGGEVLEYPNFLSIMDDLGLLRLLGVSGSWEHGYVVRRPGRSSERCMYHVCP